MSRSITFTNLQRPIIPLIILAAGAIASGWVGIPPLLGGMFGIEHSDKFGEFLAPVRPSKGGALIQKRYLLWLFP